VREEVVELMLVTVVDSINSFQLINMKYSERHIEAWG
jgi:hypothetical protein